MKAGITGAAEAGVNISVVNEGSEVEWRQAMKGFENEDKQLVFVIDKGEPVEESKERGGMVKSTDYDNDLCSNIFNETMDNCFSNKCTQRFIM